MAARILSAIRGNAAEPALKNLRNRLLAVNLASLTLVIAIAFSVVYLNFYNRAQNEIDQTLSTIPSGVIENLMLSQQSGGVSISGAAGRDSGQITISGSPQVPVDYSKSFVANIMSDGSITVFSMLEMDNQTYLAAIENVLGKSPLPDYVSIAGQARPDMGGSIRGSAILSGDVNIAGREWRYRLEQRMEAFAPYSHSIVFLDIEETNRSLGALAASLFVIGFAAVGAILLISLLVANRAILPVEESMARQRRFVADASHELKTPIAVIAANAEAANDAIREAFVHREDEREGESQETPRTTHWIANIADEANRMGDLVENLLALAKAAEKQAVATPFDLVAAVCEEADRVEAFLFEKSIDFDFELHTPQGGPLIVNSDRAKVQTALSVLLENAVKYTPGGGRVTVTVGKGGRDGAAKPRNGAKPQRAAKPRKGAKPENGAYVSVANTGAYIPPDELVRVFDRFFKADPSRNSEAGGHGIGLSIAKEIARTLNGELKATSVPRADGGAINTFTLTLP